MPRRWSPSGFLNPQGALLLTSNLDPFAIRSRSTFEQDLTALAAGNVNRWKLGLFIVTGVVAVFGAVLWLGTAQLRRQLRPAVTYFDESVQGLEVGAPLKFRGVPIGSVSHITFAKDRKLVQVDVDIYVDVLEKLGLAGPDEKAPQAAAEQYRVQLASAGITGVVFLQADVYDPERHPSMKLPFEPPPNWVPSVPSTFKSISDFAIEATNRLPEIAENGNRLLDQLQKVLKEIDLPGVSERVKRTLDTVDARLTALDAAGLSTRTATVLDEGAETMRHARRAIGTLEADLAAARKVLDRIESLGAIAERAVADAEVGRTAAAARDAGAEVGAAARSVALMGDELRGQLVVLREAVDAIRRLADMLERDPGSLIHGKSPESPPQERKP